MSDLRDIWVYLAADPLLNLTLTLLAYQGAFVICRKSGLDPLCNPMFLCVSLVVAVLWSTGTTYEAYFAGPQFVHFLLGPATVALALPLYLQIEQVRRSALALSIALVAGSLTAMVSSVAIAWLLGAGADSLIALTPKSVTAPVAMGIIEKLGGLPSLTAVLVILTGITGAMLGPTVLDLLKIRDWRARGVAMGTASHGIGTARALQVNEIAGAFSALPWVSMP